MADFFKAVLVYLVAGSTSISSTWVSAGADGTRAQVEAYFSLMNQGRPSDIAFADDVVFTSPLLEAPLVGRDPLVAGLEGAVEDLQSMDVVGILVDGDRACAEFVYRVTAGPSVPMVDCFTIAQGRIVEVRSYYDPKPFLDAASD